MHGLYSVCVGYVWDVCGVCVLCVCEVCVGYVCAHAQSRTTSNSGWKIHL